MKLTVVTNEKGKLLASMFEVSPQQPTEATPSATLVPGPGQVFRELDVPDDYSQLSPDDLHRALQEDISKPAE